MKTVTVVTGRSSPPRLLKVLVKFLNTWTKAAPKSAQMADDDDEVFGVLYENGHWVWDEVTEELVYVSDEPPKPDESVIATRIKTKVPTGTVEFRDDIDLIEQLRFRKRYQRKLMPEQANVITLQDVKDIAIYTAPLRLLSPSLIHILHINTTERFLRALILYSQYYLQIADEMVNRTLMMEMKIRTPDCKLLENTYRENLSDLRVLVAKEYSTLLIGGSDTKKFHHMGPQKKEKSLPDKDARLIETLLRICVQIIWLALGRKAFNQIELEVNRLFKSEIFNSVEHKLRTGYIAKMTKEQREVLLGRCVKPGKKLTSRSPLMDEICCHRPIDYQMMGFGVIKYPKLSDRLRYMHLAVSGPEEEINELEMAVGILGLRRSNFDTMLRPLSFDEPNTSKGGLGKSESKCAKSSIKTHAVPITKVYPDVILPDKDTEYSYSATFPDNTMKLRPCNTVQRTRWLNRLVRLQQRHI